MEVTETNEKGVFCPHCDEMLQVDWRALPPPNPSQNGSGWWLACTRCQHKWWVPCPSSPEYQESLKRLKELLTAFEEEKSEEEDSKVEVITTDPKESIPSVQVVAEKNPPSVLASLLNMENQKESDPFAAFRSLSFADWLEEQKETDAKKKQKENQNFSGKGTSLIEATLVPDSAHPLTQENWQDLKNSLLQVLRDEWAQAAKTQGITPAKMRDPRNREVLENKKGSDFFPKKTPQRPFFSDSKEKKNDEASALPSSMISEPLDSATLSTNQDESLWLRFRRHLTLRQNKSKSLMGWDGEAPFLAPVLPTTSSSKPDQKQSSTTSIEGQVIPFRLKKESTSVLDTTSSQRSRWRLFRKSSRRRSKTEDLPVRGKLVFPKKFQKASADSQAAQNNLGRLLHEAEEAHQQRQEKEKKISLPDLSPISPHLSPQLPDLSQKDKTSSHEEEKENSSLSAKAKLGLTLVGTGALAFGALFLTVHYKDTARNLWEQTALSTNPKKKSQTEVTPTQASPSSLTPEFLPTPKKEPATKIEAQDPSDEELVLTAPTSEELTLEHVSYTLTKKATDGTLVCVSVAGEIVNMMNHSVSIPPISIRMTSERWPGKLLYSGKYTHHLNEVSSQGRSAFQIEKKLPVAEDEDLKIELSFVPLEKGNLVKEDLKG